MSALHPQSIAVRQTEPALSDGRVWQRSESDCLLCAFAMFAGLTYEQAQAEAVRISPGYDPRAKAMSHSLMRRIADRRGIVLVSSIYMDWRHPGIVGVVSRTIEDCGHALYWNGAELIDPGDTGLYDRAYVDRYAIEFTQRAIDLRALLTLDEGYATAARTVSLEEYF